MVSIHKKSEGFRSDQDIVFVAKGRHQLLVGWSSPTTISIGCLSCSRTKIFRQVMVLGDIDVVYQLEQ